VQHLREEAQKIEAKLAATQVEIDDQEKDIGRLSGKLRRMGSMDSLYVRVFSVNRDYWCFCTTLNK